MSKNHDRPGRFGLAGFWQNLAPGLAISALLFVILAAAGEFYLRSRTPEFVTQWPIIFNPRVGFQFQPGAEVATTNNLEYWTRQRANSLGFLDREPVASPPGSCHVAFIGDSFVEAHQVEIAQKVQLVLEKLASERAPHLKITTAGFGMSDTGQLGQLPFYDEFARTQSPKVVVLVFVKNDFADNSALLQAVVRGADPLHMPRQYARARPAGGYELQPIDPDWEKFMLTPKYEGPAAGPMRAWLQQKSLVYRWLEETSWRAALLFGRWWYGPSSVAVGSDRIEYYGRMLAKRPEYARMFEGWNPKVQPAVDEVFFERDLPPAFREAISLTGFALDEFQVRVRRDGFKLLILATQTMVREDSTLALDRLKELARSRDIPMIDLQHHIEQQGGRAADARWVYDGHWSVQGHRWAAESVLDYVVRHPEICR